MAKHAIENSIAIVTKEQEALIRTIEIMEKELAKKKAQLVQTQNANEDLQGALVILQAQKTKEIM